MLKAICNLQRTILESPRGIVDKDEFFYNKVEHLRSLGKQERDEILTLELNCSQTHHISNIERDCYGGIPTGHHE